MERLIKIGDFVAELVLVVVLVPLVLLSILALRNNEWVEMASEKRIEAIKNEITDEGLGWFFDNNPKAVAWLKIDGTKIDYPVMQTNNNDWYLTHSFDDEYSGSGSLFVDYRNELFADDYFLIYGHRMSGENMFSEIAKFADEGFFDAHEWGELITRSGAAKLRFYAYAEVEADMEAVYNVGAYRKGRNEEMLAAIEKDIKNLRGVRIGNDDKVVILSTCDKRRRNYRDILVARMVWQ